jgi:N-acetylated-alpha-linked acidic dipeptidase
MGPPRRRSAVVLGIAMAASVVSAAPCAATPPDPSGYEARLNAGPSPESLLAWHDLLGSEPHVAGTPGDGRTIERLARAFAAMGLEVQVHEFETLLARPVSASVEIVEPAPMSLAVVEDPVVGDPSSAHPDLDIGWCAYSGSSDVSGEVVYANYATRADFEAMAARGVEVRGRIVIARYGGVFRGLKARLAEEAGAAALVLYTDPDDSGYRKGVPYPEGGWANQDSIQRGSVSALDYPGDALTPMHAASEPGVPRLEPDGVALPRIPVQPLGWGAASAIMSRMQGPGVVESGLARWQGGLPFAYRLAGGPGLIMRVAVSQERRLGRSANVVATLRGREEPELKVIVGCHHDAWGCGASDPLAGTIVLLECARSFAQAARLGDRPRRSVVFAAWGAEEFGIVGSVEWCEANREDLSRNALAYLNLDMAAMGPDFAAAGSPSLRRVILEGTRCVAQAGDPGRAVLDAWSGRAGVPEPPLGMMGGGSDHVGFSCHLAIPACGLSAGGSPGTAYHSNYDTLTWYRRAVGEDYESALMLTRLTNLIVARLAADAVLPLDLSGYAADAAAHLQELARRAEALGVAADLERLHRVIGESGAAADRTEGRLRDPAASGRLSAETLRAVNGILAAAERRCFLHEPGLPGRPWYRNLYAAPDPDSGYGAWALPALRAAIEGRDPDGVAEALTLYVGAFGRLLESARSIESLLAQSPLP